MLSIMKTSGVYITLLGLQLVGCRKNGWDCVIDTHSELYRSLDHIAARQQVLSGNELGPSLESIVVDGHYPIEGNGIVIRATKRKTFLLDGLRLIDGAVAQRISAYIPRTADALSAGRDMEVGVDAGDVIVYWWNGQIAFPTSGCIGYGRSGKISIRNIENLSATVYIDAMIMTRTAYGGKGNCDDIHLDLMLEAPIHQ